MVMAAPNTVAPLDQPHWMHCYTTRCITVLCTVQCITAPSEGRLKELQHGLGTSATNISKVSTHLLKARVCCIGCYLTA